MPAGLSPRPAQLAADVPKLLTHEEQKLYREHSEIIKFSKSLLCFSLTINVVTSSAVVMQRSEIHAKLVEKRADGALTVANEIYARGRADGQEEWKMFGIRNYFFQAYPMQHFHSGSLYRG